MTCFEKLCAAQKATGASAEAKTTNDKLNALRATT